MVLKGRFCQLSLLLRCYYYIFNLTTESTSHKNARKTEQTVVLRRSFLSKVIIVISWYCTLVAILLSDDVSNKTNSISPVCLIYIIRRSYEIFLDTQHSPVRHSGDGLTRLFGYWPHNNCLLIMKAIIKLNVVNGGYNNILPLDIIENKNHLGNAYWLWLKLIIW